MSFCVLDASIAIAWLFDDEGAPEDDRLMDLVADHGAMVPGIWPSEVANTLLMAVRRRRLPERRSAELLERLMSLDLLIEVQSLFDVHSSVIPLAVENSLTVYDASYLALALKHGLPLASRDRALRRAAQAAGIAVLPA